MPYHRNAGSNYRQYVFHLAPSRMLPCQRLLQLSVPPKALPRQAPLQQEPAPGSWYQENGLATIGASGRMAEIATKPRPATGPLRDLTQPSLLQGQSVSPVYDSRRGACVGSERPLSFPADVSPLSSHSSSGGGPIRVCGTANDDTPLPLTTTSPDNQNSYCLESFPPSPHTHTHS